MPKNQIKRMKKLGFDFMPIREHRFEESYNKLVKYHEEHGHCNVPEDYGNDPQLARWVEIQVRVTLLC